MTAPATTRRTRKTRTRTARRQRLPRLGWWWLAILLIAFGIANTWPLYTAIAVALFGIGSVTAARRPAWLQRAAGRLPDLGFHRPILNASGHRTLAAFQRMDPSRFEHAIAELAREHPAVARAETVGGANDRGADILVTLHNSHRILIQCKRYQPGNNVTSGDVQKTNGTYRDIHHCHQAVIVTTSDYTPAAYQTNGMLPKPILLINGHALEAWANGGHAPW